MSFRFRVHIAWLLVLGRYRLTRQHVTFAPFREVVTLTRDDESDPRG